MKKVIRWLTVLAVIALLAAAGVWWMCQNTETTTDTTNLVQRITVQRGDIKASISPTGEVYAEQSASLSFDVNNLPIVELNAVAGQFVRQGEILARIDTAPLQRAVDQAEAELLTAQQNLKDAQQTYTKLDESKARLAVAQAEVGLRKAIQSKEDLLNPDLAKAQKAVRDAQYTLESAQLNLELAKRNTAVTKSIRDLEYAVAWHERNVRDIQAGSPNGGEAAATTGEYAVVLAQVQAPIAPGGGGRQQPEPMTLEEAQQALTEARRQLELAKVTAASTLASAEDRVAQARDALADAQTALEKLQKGPDALDLVKADNAIIQAEYRLAKAKDDLAKLLAGPDPRVIQLAQAKVNAAQATLTEAVAALEKSEMKAPFDGTIISVNVEVGDEVSANKVVLTMANLTRLRVRAFVDETKITQVHAGQSTVITFDSFPGQRFQGVVLEVPIEGELSGNVVRYEVPLSLEGTHSVSLRPGMTANVTIETGSKQNVLRLPAYAVSQTTSGWAVMVQDVADGPTTTIPVQIGISDGTYVEIVRGLNEGDTVVAQLQEQQQQTGFFGMGGGTLTGGIQRMIR